MLSLQWVAEANFLERLGMKPFDSGGLERVTKTE